MSGEGDDDVRRRARAFADADPDPATQAELRGLISGENLEELRERMGPELDFGTAGLRGPVGAGPARMNRAVVMRAARAVADYLLSHEVDARARPVVVGYDARPESRDFAASAAGVLLAAGLSVRWFEKPTPTPLVAYAARVLMASAALVVTASHNPRGDNGLKVYGGDAHQLGSPADAHVARLRERVGPACDIAWVDIAASRSGVHGARLEPLPSALFDRYLDELDGMLPPQSGARKLRIAYTPLHGVGLSSTRRALSRRGFTDFHPVLAQAEPDGSFPTTESPNPETPGTLDAVLSLGAEVGATLVVANDPDADRLAAAVPLPSGGFRVLSGNELGLLLADFVLEHSPTEPRPLLVTSIVSSPAFGALAAARGARHELTLTGFKWIWAAARTLEAQGNVAFRFGCEEALGYSVGSLVRDKDGIAAAVWLAELAERCLRQGGTPLDHLYALYRRFGYWSSAQQSLVRTGLSGAEAIRLMVDRLASDPPRQLAGLGIEEQRDFRRDAERRAPWLGSTPLLEFRLRGGSRVLVRPSGTEPKLKIYADYCEPMDPSSVPSVLAERAQSGARSLAAAMIATLSAHSVS